MFEHGKAEYYSLLRKKPATRGYPGRFPHTADAACLPLKHMHKDKTLATLLASLFGGIGLHRFFLYGKKDFWGWVHLLTLPLSIIAIQLHREQQALFLGLPFILSVLSGFLEALVIGLTPDEKWDARHNPGGSKKTQSSWPLALLLVLTLAAGAIGLLSLLARSLDLWLTGGGQG